MGNGSSSALQRQPEYCGTECQKNKRKKELYDIWIKRKKECEAHHPSKCQPLGAWEAENEYYKTVLGSNSNAYNKWINNERNNIFNQMKEQRNLNYFPLENYQKTLTLMVNYQNQTKELLKDKVNVLERTINKLKYYISDFELSTSKWTRKSQYHLENYKKKVDLADKFKKIIITLSFICFILIIFYSGFLTNRTV